MYYGGLKFVPLGYKRLLILQSVKKVKLNLSSCSFLSNLTLVKNDVKFNFTFLTDCRINNLLNLRGTNFSPHSTPKLCTVALDLIGMILFHTSPPIISFSTRLRPLSSSLFSLLFPLVQTNHQGKRNLTFLSMWRHL